MGSFSNFVAYSYVYWLISNILLFIFPVYLVFRDYGADVRDSMCS